MYGSKHIIRRNAYIATAGQVRLRKNGFYEKTYNVKGVIKPAGTKLKPNAKCIDRIMGTRKDIKHKVNRRRKING